MFTVTTFNLAPDTRSAVPGQGHTDLGELSIEEFSFLLARFRELDSQQNLEGDPHLIVTARAGKFLVRTNRGKLLLYDARDTTVPYADLTAEEIVAQLDRVPAVEQQPDGPSAAVPTEVASTPSRGIAVAILLAGLVLNGYTLYSVFYTESVNEKPAITLVTDAAEVTARLHDATGTYATGDQPGDRAIVVTPDGKIKFLEIGARSRLTENVDIFHLGRRDKKLCLATAVSGVVDILNIDALVYYRDTYKRTK